MIEPKPLKAVQNLNTFQAITALDLCILILKAKKKKRLELFIEDSDFSDFL
jgi:hypothetical protein